MAFCISPLRRAIRAGDVGRVEALLEEAGQSSPDYINDDYSSDCFCTCFFRNAKSPIHTAISQRQWNIVWLLLKYGADPECPSGYWEQTPIHVACRQNNVNLARHLVDEHKVSVNVQDGAGRYPIHTSCLSTNAILSNDISMLKYFHNIGKLTESELKLTDDEGNTPLHIAAGNKHVNAVEYLLGLGADRNVCNVKGDKPADMTYVEDILELLNK